MYSQTTKLLGEVEKTSAFGRDSLTAVMKRISDPSLERELARCRSGYSKRAKAADEMLAAIDDRAGRTPNSVVTFMRAAIKAQLCGGSDSSKAAEMTIQGLTMGNIKIRRAMSRSTHASPMAMEAAKELCLFQEEYIEKMKKYL